MITSHSTFQAPPSISARARYIMIGGFLGAGKTTAVAALARRLTAQGKRVGLITNDQGNELVDTARLRAQGFATEEIPGGCFCCRFNSLVDAADKLTQGSRPDVFIAEPVGSCTDLVATVTYPLRRIYGDHFVIAPLSVLVDPIRAERIFELAPGKRFSEKVLYIYRKQLEEADVIVVTKADLVDETRLAGLRRALAAENPRATIREVSVREGRGVDEWFDHLGAGEQQTNATMAIDYETYAEGEALLGWLNATVQLVACHRFDADSVLKAIAKAVQSRLEGSEIAHLKMTLSPDSGLNDLAAISLVRSDFVPELSLSLEEPVTSGQLIINLRAETDPATLRDAVQGAVAELRHEFRGLDATIEHLESFRPGKPQPTHRDVALAHPGRVS